MKKGFTYIPIIIMIFAVLAVGAVGYFALRTKTNKRVVNDAKQGMPTYETNIVDFGGRGNECQQTSDCTIKPGLRAFQCLNGFCQYMNEDSNLNTSTSINTNTPTNSAINSTVNQNTNVATVTPPQATLISASAKDGSITLSWKTDLPTHNTIQYREVGGMKVAMNEDGSANTHDPYNHSVVIPNIRSGKTIEYEFRPCADLLKWRICRATCGSPGESCDRACTVSELSNCKVSQSYTVVMPEY